MICWILDKNLEDYKKLCFEEGISPHILDQREEKSHVVMTSNTATTWNMVGFWYQMG